MPLYEFECRACGRRFEQIQKFSDPPPACAACGVGPTVRLLSSPAIQFKGEGWYITDYARKGKTEGGTEAKPAGETSSEKPAAAESGGKEAKADSKPAGTTETKSSGSTAAPPAKE